MKTSTKLATAIAPLAVTFGLMTGVATAQENETLSFQCNTPDLSSMILADKVEKIMPANVLITTGFLEETPKENAEEPEEPVPFMPPPNSLGSGYIIDSENGYVVTNHHVIEGSKKVEVTFYDPNTTGNVGEKVTATVLGSDPILDVAVLKLDYEGELTCVNFGDSNKVKRAEQAFAIGNPFGKTFTFTMGYISHTKQGFKPSELHDSIQTDAAINRGNSGGGLYDAKSAKVIAMNTAIFSPSGGSVGIGFASAANDIVEIADEIIKHGKAMRGALGVGIEDVSKEIAERMNSKEGVGVLITGMSPNGPAARGGLAKNDIVLSINGVEINQSNELARKIASYDPDDVVQLKILRNGQKQTLDVTLGERSVALKALRPNLEQRPMPKLPAPKGPEGEMPPGLEEFFKDLFGDGFRTLPAPQGPKGP